MKTLSKAASALAVLAIAGAGIVLAQGIKDGATIVNSGSTNSRGYHLRVWSDGTALPVMNPESAMRVRQNIGTALTDKFFADLKAAKAANAVAQSHCMKSASFGFTLTVSYHGWTSPDLTCPPFSKEVAAVADDVRQITAAAKVSGTPPGRNIPVPGGVRSTKPEPQPSDGPIRTMIPRPTPSSDASPSPETSPRSWRTMSRTAKGNHP